MNTLTIELPDKIAPAVARWELARLLHEKGEITLEEGAKIVGLAPTYFKRRLAGLVSQNTLVAQKTIIDSAKRLDRQRFDKLIEELDIPESWETLVAQIGR